VDAITVDAYGADEQLTAFYTVFDEAVSLSCAAKVLDLASRSWDSTSKATSDEAWSPVVVSQAGWQASYHW
jgi:hypothetical protein